MFDLRIIGTKNVLYDGTALSVACDGTETEYEFLSFHSNATGVLRRGDIIINNRYKVSVKGGVVGFYDNKCLILCEEQYNPLFKDP